MQCNVHVGCDGMPQDIDDAKSGGTFGPFPSEEAAASELCKKGWYQPEKGHWHKLSGIPGDRSVATIIPIKRTRVNNCDQLP